MAEGKATNRVDSIGIYVIGEEVYEQISIEFKRYVQGSYYENQRISTGVIENDSLIWVHPYRADWFKILNLSPYPQYSPFWENGEFRDSLTVGGRYIEDTKVAAGKSIVVRSFYTSYVKDGIVTVKSKSISEAGESFLEVTFDPSIGITKMKYQTISNHEVVFRLVNVKHQED